MTIHKERHLAAEIVVSMAIVCILLLLLAVAGPTRDAKAEVCPFGECPKVTPLSCYESLFKPECEGTHIDYGNDQQEWEYISSQMPKQIQVAGNYVHSGNNQAEYFRCKYLRERRLRIGKEFSGWVKVNCREYLK